MSKSNQMLLKLICLRANPVFFIHVILLVFSTFPFASIAQKPQWAKAMGGPLTDNGRAIAVDNFGSVYTTGFFYDTSDFDPGPAVFNLIATSNLAEMFISKLDSAGNFQWACSFGSGDGYSIELDAFGNVYATGIFVDTADFDPGPGVFNLISQGLTDIFILKLDSGGNFLWAKAFGGSGIDVGIALSFDNNQAPVITGTFQYNVDFDPGIGVHFENSTSAYYATFIFKLDDNGNFMWVKTVKDGSHSCNAKVQSMSIDIAGNIYLVGSFEDSVDFDPGSGIYSLTCVGWQNETFIAKYDPNGNIQWAKQIEVNYQGGGDKTYLALDTNSDVYITGSFQQTVDFDPGIGVFNLTGPSTAMTIYILKLNSNGQFAWANQLANPSSSISYWSAAIELGSDNNIYITGRKWSISSIILAKLDTLGNQIWFRYFAGGTGRCMTIDESYIYIYPVT